MGFIENDPRDTGYIALFTAITFYKELSPEQAFRIAEGKSGMKSGNKLTPELFAEINKIIRNPNFKRIENIEQKYRINRHDIFEQLKKQKAN